MDPNAAYRMMVEHLKDGDYSEAYDMASGLRDWVRKGGFPPEGFTRADDVIAVCRGVVRDSVKGITRSARVGKYLDV